jgi:putative ATPase
VIFASEDVGNADPTALALAVNALQAVELVGLPEGVLPMSQAAIYLALAPKSNTASAAYGNARRLVKEKGPLPVPLKLRNAPTKLMESLGYGGGYRYPHNFEGHYVVEDYLPDALRGERIVELSGSGLEREIAERWRRLREAAKKPPL